MPIPLSDCQRPPNITHGDVTYVNTTYMNLATYTCQPGYESKDNLTIQCSEHGNWTQPPECQAKGNTTISVRLVCPWYMLCIF